MYHGLMIALNCGLINLPDRCRTLLPAGLTSGVVFWNSCTTPSLAPLPRTNKTNSTRTASSDVTSMLKLRCGESVRSSTSRLVKETRILSSCTPRAVIAVNTTGAFVLDLELQFPLADAM
jgi:hypothetical protein